MHIFICAKENKEDVEAESGLAWGGGDAVRESVGESAVTKRHCMHLRKPRVKPTIMHNEYVLWEICLCCCSKTAKGSDLGSKGGVHTKLAGVDYRVFWLTQRKLEGHTEEEEERRTSGEAQSFLGGREGGRGAGEESR